MARKDLIIIALGGLLAVALIALAVVAATADNNDDKRRAEIAALTERVEELESAGPQEDRLGILEDFQLDPESLGLLRELFGDEFPLRPEQLDQLRERLQGEVPLDEDFLGPLFEGFGEGPRFDRDGLGRLFEEFGGRFEGFELPEDFELPRGFFREFSFDIDPSFIEDLTGEGLLDEEQARELRDALQMLREALEGASQE